MTRFPAQAPIKSTSRLGATAALALTTTLASVALPAAALAVDSTYHLNTSAPEGKAVCTVSGSIKKGAAPAQLMLTPSMGEAELFFKVSEKSPGGSSVFVGMLGAGTQAGCDIFPDTPTSAEIPLTGKFSGLLDLHAHPGTDCGSSGVADGVLTLSTTNPKGAKLRPPKCDGNPAHSNLELRADAAPNGRTGEVLSGSMEIRNHGPGDAASAKVSMKLSKGLFLKDFSPTKGACQFDSKKNVLNCVAGPVPAQGAFDVLFDAIPIKMGKFTAGFNVAADNDGGLLPPSSAIKGNITKGGSATLVVTVKCKGAAGTVTINPNGSGGTTTCTCPDPADTTKQEVSCIETYNTMKTVALTAAATTGSFNKWSGECTGTTSPCSVTVDPAAQNADKSTTAKFK